MVSHNEYENVILNKKHFRHLMNRTQIKDHKIGMCEMNPIFLSYVDEKIYILNNEHYGIIHGYWSRF